MAWQRLKRHEQDEGRIALPPDEEAAEENDPVVDQDENDSSVWGNQNRSYVDSGSYCSFNDIQSLIVSFDFSTLTTIFCLYWILSPLYQ